MKEYYFSYEEQDSFLKLFDETNSIVAKEYMNREDGILFKDKILTKDQSVTTYSYEDLILLCGDIILKQEEDNQELRTKIKDANVLIKNLKNNISIPRKVYRKIKTIIKKI